MNVRNANRKDLPKILEFYRGLDIVFPNNATSVFVIEDDEILLAAGALNFLPEISVAMRQDIPDMRKGRILRIILDLIEHRKELGPFYVFVNEEKWEEQLKSYGFEAAKGKVLIYHGK